MRTRLNSGRTSPTPSPLVSSQTTTQALKKGSKAKVDGKRKWSDVDIVHDDAETPKCHYKNVKLRWPLNVVFLVVALGLSVSVLYMLYGELKDCLDPAENHDLKLPKTIEEVKQMHGTLMALLEANGKLVFVTYVCVYLFKQAFSVPGSVALNVIGGMFYGMQGVPLACVLSASGATICYVLSWIVAEELAQQVGPESQGRFAKTLFAIREKVENIRQREGSMTLLLYLTSMRLFPACPNWLINLVLPHAGVPIHLFFLSVLLGLTPYNFVTVSAGSVIGSVENTSDIFDVNMMIKLGLSALLLAGFAPALKFVKKRFLLQNTSVEQNC